MMDTVLPACCGRAMDPLHILVLHLCELCALVMESLPDWIRLGSLGVYTQGVKQTGTSLSTVLLPEG